MSSITVQILSYNEEQHIERAIKSVESFASQVVVIDSFSNDKTVELAEAMGAHDEGVGPAAREPQKGQQDRRPGQLGAARLLHPRQLGPL